MNLNNTELINIRKSQIISATLKAIAQVGITNLRLEDIAQEAGLSKGGIAYYYSSKEELIMDSFREFFDQIFIQSKYTMNWYIDPLDKLLSFEWLYNWKDPDVYIGYSMLFDCISLAGHDPEFQKLFHDWVENWITLLAQAVEEGVLAGIFKTKDIEGTARAISAIYHGIATRWFIDKESHTTEWAVSYSRKAISALLCNTKKTYE
jgi:AcrR family transcriptional regulator